MDKKNYLAQVAMNIRRHRAIKGLRQDEVATAAGLSRQGYLSIENAKAEPKTGNLQKIADALNIKLFDLFEEQPTFSSLRFRSKKTMTAKDRNIREQTLFEFRKWLDNYKFLEARFNEYPQFKLADLIGGKSSPKEMAEKARAILNLKENEIISDICGLMESAGLKGWHSKAKSQAFFGFSLSKDDGGPAIGVNVSEGISVERKIFTVAHELGHILLHPASYRAQDVEESESDEHEADSFAGYFLMPDKAFVDEWNKDMGFSFVDRVLRFKRRFKVSYRTVLVRLAEKSGQAVQDIFIRFSVEYKKAYKHDLKDHFEPESVSSGFKGEPQSALNNLDFMEERFKRLVRKAFEEELISTGKAAEMLGLKLDEMRGLGISWRETP